MSCDTDDRIHKFHKQPNASTPSRLPLGMCVCVIAAPNGQDDTDCTALERVLARLHVTCLLYSNSIVAMTVSRPLHLHHTVHVDTAVYQELTRVLLVDIINSITLPVLTHYNGSGQAGSIIQHTRCDWCTLLLLVTKQRVQVTYHTWSLMSLIYRWKH